MYDAVIIGGGPAGASAGIYLADKGKSVCIIDKSTFPRQKTCGGLLTVKTLELMEGCPIGKLDGSLVLNKINKVSLKNKGRKVAEMNCRNDFYLVDRLSFDNSLIEKYKAKGGNIIEGNAVTEITDKGVVLNDGTEIECRFIIGADGCKGITQKYVERRPVDCAFGVEADIPIRYVDSSALMLEVGYFKDGYIWHFPKGEYATVGFAFTYDKNFEYMPWFRRHIKRLGVTEDVKLKGAFLPYGMGSRIVTNGRNLLLTGDAAGFIDAVTGEGTYYAILSGLMAGESLMTDDPIRSYEKKTSSIVSSVEKSCKLVNKFYNNREDILGRLKGKTRFLSWFCDVQVSRNIYDFSLSRLSAAYMKYKLFGEKKRK